MRIKTTSKNHEQIKIAVLETYPSYEAFNQLQRQLKKITNNLLQSDNTINFND